MHTQCDVSVICPIFLFFFFFFFLTSKRRHTRLKGDWISDVCSSDLVGIMRKTIPQPLRANKLINTPPIWVRGMFGGGIPSIPVTNGPLPQFCRFQIFKDPALVSS